jgi:uncharacterized protein (DUF4415 family)
MQFTWSERKRAINLREHGLDFVDAVRVFEGLTFTYEDDRLAYGEQRFVTLGFWPVYRCPLLTRSRPMKSASSPSAKQAPAKRSAASPKSRTDWPRLMSAEKARPTQEHPEFEPSRIVRGIVRRGLQPVPAKELISLRIDQDVIEWFKAQGPGYQTRINSVLRAFRDASAA